MRHYLLGLMITVSIFVWAVYLFDPDTFHQYVAEIEPFVFTR
jgi:hypothetical protein